MGCDGGTIPKRDELVKLKKKPEQKDKDAELAFRWRHCALSQQVLQKPIAACGLGRLYSKSALIEYLLDKTNVNDNMKHLKNLKDIKELKLTKNPAFQDKAEKTEGAIDERGAPYICPIIGLEMSGKFRFVFIWSCGCVMSERAFKEVKQRLCHLCMEPFEETDVVIINGTDEDMELMKTNMEIRQAKSKDKKKNKKIEAKSLAQNEEKAIETSKIVDPSKPIVASTTSSTITSTSSSTIAPASSSTISKMITADKLVADSSKTKLMKRPANSSSMQDPVYKKTKDDYSVAKDPKATSVYKSIFTSHHTEKEQKRAHWITYNPFYN